MNVNESLAFENDNSEYKRVIRSLKERSAPIDEWIRDTADIGSHIFERDHKTSILTNFYK